MGLVAFLAGLTGCVVVCGPDGCKGHSFPGKFEKTQNIDQPFKGNIEIAVNSPYGNIEVTGDDVSRLRIDAHIVVRAETDELAGQFAENIFIGVETWTKRASVIVMDPLEDEDEKDYSISVDYIIRLPRDSSLELESHNGCLRITNIAGHLKGTTHNGEIIAQSIGEDVQLLSYNGSVDVTDAASDVEVETHNGTIKMSGVKGDLVCKSYNLSILAEEVAGDVRAEAHNGKITIQYVPEVEKELNIRLFSYNGAIKLKLPQAFSAQFDIKTQNGKIKTSVPLTIDGEIDSDHYKGKIGDGRGQLDIETHNGSIYIE